MENTIFDFDLREEVAQVQHEVWIHWMNYLFSASKRNSDGTYTIPCQKVIRWQRQMLTSYNQLSEREKESDREIADRVISTLDTYSGISFKK